MTIAIACEFDGGVTFCADTKISGRTKANETKIFASQWGDLKNCVTVFTYAGGVSHATSAIRRCEHAISELDFTFLSLDRLEQVLSSELSSYYQTHVFPHPDRNDPDSIVKFDLLIGLWLNGQIRTLSTEETGLSLVEGFKCIGAGAYLAQFLMREALGRNRPERLTWQEACLISDLAISEVAEYDEHCEFDDAKGGAAEFFIMHADGLVGSGTKDVPLVYAGTAQDMKAALWITLRRLAAMEDRVDAELALEDFKESVAEIGMEHIRRFEEFFSLRAMRQKQKGGNSE